MSDPAAMARALFEREDHAVLASAHADFDGWPFASILPYAVLPGGDAAVFLSAIAEHTKNLLRFGRGCLFVADPASRERPQAGARIAVMVRARQPDGAEAQAAAASYFARFPKAEAMRGHGFSVWILEVERVRWIAGFGSMGWIERAAWTGGAAG